MTGSEAMAVLLELREFRAEVRGELKAIQSDNEDGELVHLDHEQRIRILESVRWKVAGIAAAAGALSGGGLVTVLAQTFGSN